MSQIRKRVSTDLFCRAADDSSQDWVCLKCNNLNFSFRNKCNRCKVQSRQDNQLLYADYYYYNQYYGYHQTEQTQQFECSENLVPVMEGAQTPRKKSYMSQSELSIRVVEDDHLPSVSPLIKRYRAGNQRANRKGKNSVFGWKLFEAQCWSVEQLPLVIRVDAPKDLSLTDDEQASQQFAKSVQKMII